MPILPSRLRALAVMLPLASLGACHSWNGRPIAQPEPDRILAGPVRVTRTDGSRVVLASVRMDRDSLFGNEQASPHGRVAIPISSVRTVEARRVNPIASAGVVVLSVAAGALVFANLLLHEECDCLPPS